MRYKQTVYFLIAFLAFIGTGTRAIASDPSNHRAAQKFVTKGDNQFIKSHLAKAQEWYFKAYALDSTDAYTNFQIGAIYYISDSQDKIAALFSQDH